MPIVSDGNKISVLGELTSTDCARLLAAMHNEIHQRGYPDIALDFSGCTKAFSPEMIAVCAKSLQYQRQGIDVGLAPPIDERLRRLFLNTNWAHFIDSQQYGASRYRGYSHSPAIQFSTAKEQSNAVDDILQVMLAALLDFSREDLRAIEWAINEITDNVIIHSQSLIGGLVQVTNHRQRSQIEFVVGDAGVGIPGSLRPSRPAIRTDQEALDAAIREGVTRDKKLGQGNGLYGTWQISTKSLGSFRLVSGYAALNSSEKAGLQIEKRDIPFIGTLVCCRIGYATRLDLQDALVFSGEKHTPVDYIETHFATEPDGSIVFDLALESDGFGSRAAGEPVRRKLQNVLKMCGGTHVSVDLDKVLLVSSSYADEVFGKLFVELGPLEFGRRINIRNIDPLVQALIDKAILQRTQQQGT